MLVALYSQESNPHWSLFGTCHWLLLWSWTHWVASQCMCVYFCYLSYFKVGGAPTILLECCATYIPSRTQGKMLLWFLTMQPLFFILLSNIWARKNFPKTTNSLTFLKPDLQNTGCLCTVGYKQFGRVMYYQYFNNNIACSDVLSESGMTQRTTHHLGDKKFNAI